MTAKTPPAAPSHEPPTAEEINPHQEELLDEGVEETFPASDPVAVNKVD